MGQLATLPVADRMPLKSSAIVGLVPLFEPYLATGFVERAVVAGFDGRGQLCTFAEVAGGAHSVASVLPAIRSVLAEIAVTAIVLAHSHPAQPSTPSRQDRLTTDRLAALARLAGVQLLDHLIYGNDGVFSLFAERRVASFAKAFLI